MLNVLNTSCRTILEMRIIFDFEELLNIIIVVINLVVMFPEKTQQFNELDELGF